MTSALGHGSICAMHSINKEGNFMIYGPAEGTKRKMISRRGNILINSQLSQKWDTWKHHWRKKRDPTDLVVVWTPH